MIRVIAICLLLEMVFVFLFHFDQNEASITNGRSYDIGSDWELITEGGSMSFDMPRTVAETEQFAITRTIDSSYSDRTLGLTINNATIAVLIDENTIYEEDGAKQPSRLIDLPEVAGNTLSISIIPDDVRKTVNIRDAFLIRKDVGMIERLKSSLIPLLCSFILLLCAGFLCVFLFIQKKTGWDNKGIEPLIPASVLLAAYCLLKPEILPIFFGNGDSFRMAELFVILMLPIPVSQYLLSGKERIGKTTSCLLLLCGIICIQLMLFKPESWLVLNVVPAILISVSTLLGISGVPKMRIHRLEHLSAYLLMLVFGIFTTATVVPQLQYLAYSPALISGTASVVIMTVIQAALLVSEYRKTVETSEQAAIAANEAKSRFLASMSHEIRTPINAVLGMDEMILKETKDQNIRSYASDIYSAGHLLLSIINDILDISKIESGKMEIVPVDYDTRGLIRDVINMTELKAKNKGLAFSVAVDPSLPTTLHGDDARIKQCMLNILSNAVKYTEKGQVSLQIRWKNTDNAHGLMKVAVKDTGIGIKEEDMPKLFEEFERIEETRNRNIEGTGLGMSITLKMLALMGSKLKVKSIYGKGSTFWFVIDQETVDATPVGELGEHNERFQDVKIFESRVYAPEVSVLAVDDNELNRKVVKGLLKGTGIKVTEASSGQEAVKILKREAFDLILLDHMMPQMDGVQTLAKIRQMGLQTPCYALTANVSASAKDQYIKEGFDGFVPKPVSGESLENVIMEAIPKNKLMGNVTPKKTEEDTAIPDINGIDSDYLLLHMGDSKTAMSIIKDFYNGMDGARKKLNLLLKDLNSSGEFSNYRISAHAMKGSLMTVGAVQLSGLAKTLEFAARDEDLDTINTLHPLFIRDWAELMRNIKGGLMIKNTKKMFTDKDTIGALLMIAESSVAAMDPEQADSALEKLSSSDGIPPELLSELSDAIAALDEQATKTAAERIRGIIDL